MPPNSLNTDTTAHQFSATAPHQPSILVDLHNTRLNNLFAHIDHFISKRPDFSIEKKIAGIIRLVEKQTGQLARDGDIALESLAKSVAHPLNAIRLNFLRDEKEIPLETLLGMKTGTALSRAVCLQLGLQRANIESSVISGTRTEKSHSKFETTPTTWLEVPLPNNTSWLIDLENYTRFPVIEPAFSNARKCSLNGSSVEYTASVLMPTRR